MPEAISAIVRLTLLPLSILPEWLGLFCLALVTTLLALLSLKWLTPQVLIERCRAQMAAAVLESRLYVDHPLRVVACQVRAFGFSLLYLVTSLPAAFAVVIVVFPYFGPLDASFGYEALGDGPKRLLEVVVAENAAPADIEAATGEGVVVVAGPHYVASTRTLAYRIAIPGKASLICVGLAGGCVDKEVGRDTFSRERVRGWAALAAISTEPPLPAASGLQRIRVSGGSTERDWGWGLPWWGLWGLLCLPLAFALRRPLGVSF